MTRDILDRLRDHYNWQISEADSEQLHEDSAREIAQLRAIVTHLLAFIDGRAPDSQPAPDAEERAAVIVEARRLVGRG